MRLQMMGKAPQIACQKLASTVLLANPKVLLPANNAARENAKLLLLAANEPGQRQLVRKVPQEQQPHVVTDLLRLLPNYKLAGQS